MKVVRGKFKYRTGLEATSTELIGDDVLSTPQFNSKFKRLIAHIQQMKWNVLIADRMDESLLVMAFDLVSE